jgi:hypothetical protein
LAGVAPDIIQRAQVVSAALQAGASIQRKGSSVEQNQRTRAIIKQFSEFNCESGDVLQFLNTIFNQKA